MNEQMLLDSNELLVRFLTLPSVEEQKYLLTDQSHLIDACFVDLVKAKIDEAIHANLEKAIKLSDLLELIAQHAGNLQYQALAWLAKGNVQNIGMADYPKAIGSYDAALDLYMKLGDPIGQARVRAVRLWALSWVGRYQDAISDGECCIKICEEQAQWKLLASSLMNLSQVHVYKGNDKLALCRLDQASDIIREFLPEQKVLLASIDQNRAISLRNLGDFKSSIQASMEAWNILSHMGQPVEAARAKQNLAITLYLLGFYNEALENLDEAYTIFQNDQRWTNAMVAELNMTDCFLSLRRYDEVIDICSRIRLRFRDLQIEQVVGEILVNEAVAFIQLSDYEAAQRALSDSLLIFQQLNHPLWSAIVQQEQALLFQRISNFSESIALACKSAAIYKELGYAAREAEALLLAATSALSIDQVQQAYEWVERSLFIGQQNTQLHTNFRAHQLMALLQEKNGLPYKALDHYEASITALERLRNSLMLEHRAQFLGDKNTLYESSVDLSLRCDNIHQAFEYAERAKSRTLIELLDRKLDLQIRARRVEDEPLVEELNKLQCLRDQLQNQLLTQSRISNEQDGREALGFDHDRLQRIEREITQLWYKLLMHNADYAREANLSEVIFEPLQPYIPKNTVLIEYFVVKGRLIAFCVERESIAAIRLEGSWPEVQTLLQKWQINLQAVSRNSLERAKQLLSNALGILQRLNGMLLAPFSERLGGKQLIFVPHGSLHYAPFHAFHNGKSYLIENHEITYLPAASLLRFPHPTKPHLSRSLVYGNTRDATLSHICQEVRAIAQSLSTEGLLDADIDKSSLVRLMESAQVIHLATHGQFHPENPLFSGLELHDGWLTALDIFNLRLNASLVTLSGCNTGKNHILGGDEVSGLMRAFLSAGAQSLLLSMWPIEDSISAEIMTQFYQLMAQGISKSAALRTVQLRCLQQTLSDSAQSTSYMHPFFWAPYFLVGD